MSRMTLKPALTGRKRIVPADSERGVTVIELVITLAIVCIILSVCSFSFSSVSRRQMEEACSQLQGDIRYAQRMAIIEGIRYRVGFDQKNSAYTLKRMEKPMNKYKQIKEVFLQNGIKIAAVNTSYVEYNPKGTNSAAFTVILESRDYLAEMTVNVGAGRAAVKNIVKKP